MAAAVVLAGEVAPPKFAAKPAVTKSGAGAKIAFTVDREMDVAVYVEDAQGKIVRHLAAGLLGTNAPAPLKPDALEQTLAWDGKDDLGQPVTGAPSRCASALA